MFKCIDQHAPNFSKSVIGRDILTPPDLERIIGLTGGVSDVIQHCAAHVLTALQNIFHGSMSLDQLYSLRTTKQTAAHRTPIAGLFMCGSSTHPGARVQMHMHPRLIGSRGRCDGQPRAQRSTHCGGH